MLQAHMLVNDNVNETPAAPTQDSLQYLASIYDLHHFFLDKYGVFETDTTTINELGHVQMAEDVEEEDAEAEEDADVAGRPLAAGGCFMILFLLLQLLWSLRLLCFLFAGGRCTAMPQGR